MNNNYITLAFDYLEEVNYALVQSKMNICKWCIIENNSDLDMENIQLEISGEYVEKYISMYFRLDVKQRIRIQNIKLQVKIDSLLSLTEKVTSNLTLKIRTSEEILKELTCFLYEIKPTYLLIEVGWLYLFILLCIRQSLGKHYLPLNHHLQAIQPCLCSQ